ncbi:hypothetical protein GCM10009557_40770 [Virgisporangium ochraceum]|uniref:Uncharacterized protein n=1 Tax=Virgisporangium ochraceum TaxID=65505 RepID=A0A8J4A1E2_9ACTN|nr:hypothetical protein [Virgisporangium ochraceum]GIJ71091.1 hypothetical protein Voc01_060080 [Virgisporangium ochraceum]
MMARPWRGRRPQVIGLPALVLLASLLVVAATALSMAVAALAPVPVGGSAGPVLGAATSGPSATTGRTDVRVLAVRTGTGSVELDLLSGHSAPYRSAEAVTGWPVPAFASGPVADGDARQHRGRAPPPAR